MEKIKKYLIFIFVICFACCTKVLATNYEDATLEVKEIITDISTVNLLNDYEDNNSFKIELLDNDSDLSSVDNKNSFCVDSSPIWQYIGYFLLIIKIVIPILIVILGVIDIGKAAISNDEKALSKASDALVKRLVMGISIFFIPTIISFIFSLIISAAPQMEAIKPCEKCLLNPTGNECKNYKETGENNRKNNQVGWINNSITIDSSNQNDYIIKNEEKIRRDNL